MNVGDLARVVGDDYARYGYANGMTVRIVSSDLDYRVEPLIISERHHEYPSMWVYPANLTEI